MAQKRADEHGDRVNSGKRNEIALEVGFKLGKVARSKSPFPRYADKSTFAQNARSWASLLNFGILSFFFIYHSVWYTLNAIKASG